MRAEDARAGATPFGARYYAANLGTWMSPDPVTIHEAGSTANPYEYVGGAPIMAVDPDGREPITLGIVITAVIVGATIGAGTSIVIQAANNGWSNIDWGLKGVAGAALTGAVTGAVTCGIGGALGGSLSGALGSVGGGLTTGALAGATAGAAGYVTSSLAAGQRLSWSGLGKAMAIGGAAGLVGAAGGIGGQTLGGGGVGGDVLGSVGGTIGGAAGGTGTQLMFGDQIDPMTVALSAGIGLAAGMAQVGVKMAGAPGFGTPEEAISARDAALIELGRSDPTNEYAATVYQHEGRFHYSEPLMGTNYSAPAAYATSGGGYVSPDFVEGVYQQGGIPDGATVLDHGHLHPQVALEGGGSVRGWHSRDYRAAIDQYKRLSSGELPITASPDYTETVIHYDSSSGSHVATRLPIAEMFRGGVGHDGKGWWALPKEFRGK